MPFFVYNGSLLCNMAAFKAHCAFGFWLGTQVVGDEASDDAMGQMGRITGVDTLPSAAQLSAYITKAMALTDAGATLVRGSDSAAAKSGAKKTGPRAPVPIPPELAQALTRHPTAKAVFDAFSPSHQREYAEWIAEARKPETRERRVLQALEMLAEGKGRNWKYEGAR